MAEAELRYSPMLGRRTRTGPWDEQIRSTYRLIQEAIDAGQWDRAAELANYFVEEAEVCFAIYRQWIPDLRAHLRPVA
jgi:Mlc titration factor MtfA (ptsG expression regulator)